MEKYVVTATPYGRRREIISKEFSTRKQAIKFIKVKKKEMKSSIPKYRWAENMRIKKI